MKAQWLIDRYNVGLAQAVLLRSVLVKVEVRNERPARYRQLFRRLKFHRLLYRVEGSMRDGYVFHIDGPLSLFSATTKYGLQVALFLPALLHCSDFRLEAELRWGPKREPRSFLLEPRDGLVSHQADTGTYTPVELKAFVERFRQVAPDWEISECTDVIELGREGVWVPDYRLVHTPTGNRCIRRGRGILETVEPRTFDASAPPLRSAPVCAGDFRPAQGRRGSVPGAGRADPPVQRDPQCDRAGCAPRSLRRSEPSPANRSSPDLLDVFRPDRKDESRGQPAPAISCMALLLHLAGHGLVRPGPPKRKQTVPGLGQPVEILRDQWGISHIYARNEHDLFLAQGFNAARDRLFQLELWRRQATGTLAEIVGPRALLADVGARLLRFRGDMRRELSHYHPRGDEIVTAFVAGINAYIELTEREPARLPLEFRILGIRPGKWTPEVVVSRHNGLFRNVTQEVQYAQLVHLLGGDRAREFLNLHPGIRSSSPISRSTCP